MTYFIGIYLIYESSYDVLLTDKRIETARSETSVKREIRHKFILFTVGVLPSVVFF